MTRLAIEVGQTNHLQTKAMWGRGGILGRPDYAPDLSTFNLRVIIVYISCLLIHNHVVIPGASAAWWHT